MSGYTGPIIDVDVHHQPRTDAELVDFLPQEWKDYAGGGGRSSAPILPVGGPGTLLTFGRFDAWGEDGSPPASSYQMLRNQILDKYNYFRAVLTHQLGDYGAIQNQYFAQALCRAANDWTIETWLGRDERLFSLVAIPTSMPDQAAAEIRRIGKHPKLVGVLLCGNPFGRAVGDPIYHPIYAAATELGLPIVIHPSLADRPNYMITATGGPLGYIDAISQYSQQAGHYISSLIVHGVFEKFPDIRFLIMEFGIGWLPSVMWRLDQNYDLLKLESPWVKRLPSEYIKEHIKFSTQPIEESPDHRDGLATLLQTVDGVEDLLCFSTDYPHGSMDEPDYVARQLPQTWWRKVFCTNACETYGWPAPAADWTPDSRLVEANA